MRSAPLLVLVLLTLAGCMRAPEPKPRSAVGLLRDHCETYFVSLRAPGLFQAMPTEGGRDGFSFTQYTPDRGLPLHVTGLSEAWGGAFGLQGVEWRT